MPTVNCPIKGFEKVKITYPDEWLMKHIDRFYAGLQSAPEGSAPLLQEIYGSLSLCDKVEGVDLDDINNLPMSYRALLNWIVKEVYIDSYLPAATVPNESTP